MRVLTIKPILPRSLLSALVASALLLVAFLTTSQSGVRAQEGETPTPEIPKVVNDLPPLEGKISPPKYPNMDSALNLLLENANRPDIGEIRSQMGLVAAEDDAELIGVSFYVEESIDELVRHLREHGVEPSASGEAFVSAYVPADVLISASALPGVWYVRAMEEPMPLVEPARGLSANLGEGVAIHGADAWHAAGYKGQRVRIGIIDHFNGFEPFMGTELPTLDQIKSMCNVDYPHGHAIENCIWQSDSEPDHGILVAEVVYDHLPEATYYLGLSGTWDNLRRSVEWMAEEEVDIIVMSIGSPWSGPGDGTSVFENSVVNTINYATEQGVLWVNAAGNERLQMWLGEFRDEDEDGWHEWEDGDECNSVFSKLYLGGRLRWDGVWGEEQDFDFDIYIYGLDERDGTPSGQPVKFSEGATGRRGVPAPYESVQFYMDDETPANYCFAIRKDKGGPVNWMQFHFLGGGALERITGYGSIASPAEHPSPSLLAVGGAQAEDPSVLYVASSAGPTPDGRTKPEIVGVQDIYSFTFGRILGGTSISAPQVAGLAGLVKQAHPHFSAVQIAQYLKTHAEPRGEVPNNDWGYGLAMLPNPDTIETATPTPEPEPGCVEYLAEVSHEEQGELIVEDLWHEGCESLRPAYREGERYGRYYMFTLNSDANVTISLESSEDTFLYLLEDFGKDGDVVAENDDRAGSPSTFNSLIVLEGLPAGDYTIDATTYTPGITGEFTLLVKVEPPEAIVGSAPPARPEPTPTPEPTETPAPTATPEPTPTETPTPEPAASCVEYLTDVSQEFGAWLRAESEWHEDCESLRPAYREGERYGRYYMFTLNSDANVTISLESSEDTFLYLLEDFGKDGDVVAENDDRAGSPSTFNSLIVLEGLPAGDYTIDATTYTPGITGEFTLLVKVEPPEAIVGSAPPARPEPTPTPEPTETPAPTATPEPTPTETPTPEPAASCVEYLTDVSQEFGAWLRAESEWHEDCESLRPAYREGERYGRYYMFTLNSDANVTISLESSEDTFLYLLEGLRQGWRSSWLKTTIGQVLRARSTALIVLEEAACRRLHDRCDNVHAWHNRRVHPACQGGAARGDSRIGSARQA